MGVSPHLLRSYELAREHSPHPNPRVGAVVVSSEGVSIGEGAHQRPGRPHAEVVALDQAIHTEGSTVYVSLEPCSHHGRTPPCTERLIADGVARVVIGSTDPDVRVSGGGVAALRAAGIEVEVVNDAGAREVDPSYFHHRETGMPLVTLKYAMTLDGSVAAADGTSRWITSQSAREDAHLLRASADAVVIGAGTLALDDPSLDVRVPDYQGHQPRPVIVAGDSPLPESAKLWKRHPLVVSAKEMDLPAGELMIVGGGRPPDPEAVCRALGDAGYLAILVEGGPKLVAAWLRAGVIQRGSVYIGSRMGLGVGMPPVAGVFGNIGDAKDVEITEVERLDGAVRIDFTLES